MKLFELLLFLLSLNELCFEDSFQLTENKGPKLLDNKDLTIDNKSSNNLDNRLPKVGIDSNNLILSSHPFCKTDISNICGRIGIQLENNLAVLNCVQNDNKREDIHLSPDCHHLIWSYKRNLTNDNRFSSVAKSVCSRLIAANGNCLEAENEKVLSPSANLLSCLIERIS